MGHPAIAFGSSALPRHHQPADGLIHHRPVIDGQKLLADSLGNGYNLVPEAVGRGWSSWVNLIIDQFIRAKPSLIPCTLTCH